MRMMGLRLDHGGWVATVFAAMLAFAFLPAAAQERFLDIRPGGQFKPVTIAVTKFASSDTDGAKLSGIITNNFKRSVFLSPTDAAGFPEADPNPEAPQIAAWQATGAQFVVTGRTQKDGGRIKTEFRLWDTSNGQQVAGQQYTTDASNSRRVAHIISDAIFTRITGEKGFFDSRVVFVDESGPAEKRRKRLAIMDQDGGNVKYLTRGDDLVVTPRFSPTAQEVTYMAFGEGDPKVYLLNIETGQREIVGNFPGMTFAPRFSPDGSKVVMSLSEGSTTNLYSLDLQSKATTRLTNTQAIDTSPSYSPDGSQIVFESDRGGTQQIYLMSASGGAAKRLSFGEGRYSTPVWSPKGRLHRLHAPEGQQLRHRRHEARWVGRAHPHGRFPQRRPDLGPERPLPDVLPRPRRLGWLEDRHDGRVRPGRVPGADPGLRLRSGLGPTAELRLADPSGATLWRGYAHARCRIIDRPGTSRRPWGSAERWQSG